MELDQPDVDERGLVTGRPVPADAGGPPSVAAVLDEAVADRPDAAALVGRTGRYTVTELDAEVDRVVAGLQDLGVEPGDRVGVALPNDVHIVIVFLAVMRAGAVWVGVNRPLVAPEKAYLLADAQVSVFIGDLDAADEVLAMTAELPELRRVIVVAPGDPDDEWSELCVDLPPQPAAIDPLAPAAIAYTSGTTGFPKGAVHSQHNLLLPGTVARHRGRLAAGDVLGVALPLTILNLIVLGPLSAYQAGQAVVAMDRIDAVGMAEWIAAEQISMFAAVPAMVHDLLTHPDVTDEMLASLVGIGVGGADMPDAFRRLYEDRFGTPVGTGYGLTEAPTAVTMEDVSGPLVPDSCGTALDQNRIVITGEDDLPLPPGEVGEVCVGAATDGPFAGCWQPMLGYWNRPEATAEALRGGLLHTGDLGVLDEHGNLFIRDRKHDLIVRGGANVYPAEVERVLHDDERVAACAVVGRPDERLGETVVAFVEAVDGADLDLDALRDRCGEQLARYKVPAELIEVDGFERTPMGKIRKTVLRERLAARQ